MAIPRYDSRGISADRIEKSVRTAYLYLRRTSMVVLGEATVASGLIVSQRRRSGDGKRRYSLRGETVNGAPTGTLRRIALPKPARRGAVSVEEVLRRRRSVRDFAPAPLTLSHLGTLLWAAQGISGGGLRTAPSAGAAYPLELAVVAGNLLDLEPGVYSYDPPIHSLCLRRQGDRREELAAACNGQLFVSQAPAAVVIAAVVSRTAVRYGGRARRYVDQEVGCAAENLALEAVALGLGSVMVGAFNTDDVARLIIAEAGAEPACVMPIGQPWRTQH